MVVNCHVEIAKGCTDPSMNLVEGGIATPDRRKIAETNDTTRPSPVASPTANSSTARARTAAAFCVMVSVADKIHPRRTMAMSRALTHAARAVSSKAVGSSSRGFSVLTAAEEFPG